jgi:hypothetical protein
MSGTLTRYPSRSTGIIRGMISRTPTPEDLRILRAAAEGRLRSSSTGRWQIEGENRPDRKSRERLRSRNLIWYGYTPAGHLDYGSLVATPRGQEVLNEAARQA